MCVKNSTKESFIKKDYLNNQMTKEHAQIVKEHFETAYQNYDKLIKKLIPKYEQMHKLVVDSLDFPKNAKIKVLDLGIGTGHTSLMILKKFPNAEIHGHDIAENMLNQARVRLKKYSSRVKIFQGNISKAKFKEKYDAVVSVLCIHHLNAKEKKAQFKKIYNLLNRPGVFAIGDIVKFDTTEETKAKEEEWKEILLKNLGPKKAKYYFENYLEEDIPDSTNNQLKWLKNAGFNEVNCVFEHINYAVIHARKI